VSALISGVRSGEALISFPTDTVPALAARPDCSHLIFEAKQRSLDKPLILMAGAVNDLWPYVQGPAEALQIWRSVAERYLPGPLTLVLPASNRVPLAMNPMEPGTIGVRVPNHLVAITILRQTGPLATTSANLSGQPPLLSLADIEARFPQVLTLSPTALQELQPISTLATASLPSGIPSTVAKWTENGWQILRQGAVILSS
jgi:L-threonylcarbamoyladenylate synthase